MNKVTNINLNGTSYQLEEAAYHALQQYLKQAEATLDDNPDKTEIIADLEQAVADKCQLYLKPTKNVVTEAEMTKILEQMGSVETGEDEADAHQAHTGRTEKLKRLYVLPKGSMIMGVANGLAAYFGADVTIVRLLFVVAAVVSGGTAILIYLILAIVLPYAKTSAQLAEAYGKPVTAKEVIEQAAARAANPEAVHNISAALMRILRVVLEIAHVVLGMIFGILTTAWVFAMWALIFGHLHLYGQLNDVSPWTQGLIISSVYATVSFPFLLMSRLFDRLGQSRPQTRLSSMGEGSVGVLWGIALVAVLGFAAFYRTPIVDYVNSHNGYFDVGTTHLCVDHSTCDIQSDPFHYHYRTLPGAPLVTPTPSVPPTPSVTPTSSAL